MQSGATELKKWKIPLVGWHRNRKPSTRVALLRLHHCRGYSAAGSLQHALTLCDILIKGAALSLWNTTAGSSLFSQYKFLPLHISRLHAAWWESFSLTRCQLLNKMDLTSVLKMFWIQNLGKKRPLKVNYREGYKVPPISNGPSSSPHIILTIQTLIALSQTPISFNKSRIKPLGYYCTCIL